MRLRLGLLAATLALGAASAAHAAALPKPLAEAYLVQNATTGETLLSHDARDRVPIASITKLMTVLVTLEHAKLDEVVTIPPIAAGVGESTLGLRTGERVTVRDLLEGALIQSANDAAYALASYVGGGSVPRFVELMNARARTLGLTDTHFTRPDGLDAPGHVSSARDVTKLAQVAMRKSFVRETVDDRYAVAAGRRLHTWNDLLGRFPNLIGVKTGHTEGAGWSQVAAARGNGYTVYATILGSPSRAQRNSDLTQLLAWGLSRYRYVRVIERGRVYATAQTQYGKRPLKLVTHSKAIVLARVDRSFVQRVVAPRVVALPVREGEPLGHVNVYKNGQLFMHRTLFAAETIEKPGVAGRVEWYAGRALSHAWGWIS